MRLRLVSAAAALLIVAGCKPAAPQPAATPSAAPTPAPSPGSPELATDLGKWVVGTWSFESNCGSDFQVSYGANGSLDNSGDTGRWSIAGDKVTEAISEKLDENGEHTVKLSPPETRSYTLERIDGQHGSITYQGRKVPILRC